MKLFEDIELRLSDAYQQRKRLADGYESVYFFSEAQIFSYNLALEHFKQAIQAEYDKLCPKPSEFKGYEWYAIESDGEAHFIKVKPNLYDDSWIEMREMNAGVQAHKVVELPLGIDWRLCCWSIEDAKRIHGEDK